jgi:nicotinamidase-related amidase
MGRASYTAPEFHRSALITIDVQCDFLDGGSCPIPGTSAALPAMARLARAFRAAHRPIFHMMRIYLPDGSNAELCRREALEEGAQIVLPNTQGMEISPALVSNPGSWNVATLLAGAPLDLGPNEWALFKPRWGAFYKTSLEELLRAKDISTLVFCGCNFPNCPRTSIYEASERDFGIVLAEDAISGLYEQGRKELLGIGVSLMTVDEVEQALIKSY